ncbi:Ubiquitin conjugation factor E4 A [Coemansia sp. RSA 1807]|nr:Ubiquitin conjugation factor E4 A [Coemansia sp. RSA 1807]
MTDRGYKWEFLGKLSWEDNASMWQGVCNKELNPMQVEQARGQATRIGTWIPAERMDGLLHFVRHVKIRVSAMHHAVALGIGGVEIWAQPSQRMPWRQREQAWITIRNVTAEHNNDELLKDTVKKTRDCPPEFIDTITQNIMQDPVILPSNTRCDRTTITRHLVAHSTDPFTGLPLSIGQIRPDLSLQLRIRAWHNK